MPGMSAGDRPPEGDRLALVDIGRLFCILVVMALHFSEAHAFPVLRSPEWWTHIWRNGHSGVRVFFVISGFVITRTLLQAHNEPGRISLRDFYVRRIARIQPLLLFSIAVGLLLRWVFASSPGMVVRYCLTIPRAQHVTFWLTLATFTFNWLLTMPGVRSFGLHWTVLWSLSVEEQFYLIYPVLLRRLATRRRVAWFLIGVLLLCPVLRIAAYAFRARIAAYAFRAGQSGTWAGAFFNLAHFEFGSFGAFDLLALGALFQLFLDRFAASPRRPALERAAFFAGLAGMGLTYWLTNHARLEDLLYTYDLMGICFCAMLYGGLRQGWGRSGLARGLAYLGQLSYAAYLLHPIVLMLLWPLLSYESLARAVLLFTSATFLVSALVHHGLERPANRVVRRLFSAGPRFTLRRAAS